MSATPSTARLYCCTGPAPSWPAGYTFNVNDPSDRAASSSPNQLNSTEFVWCCGGTKFATDSSSADAKLAIVADTAIAAAPKQDVNFMVSSQIIVSGYPTVDIETIHAH
jgi:hypothetical protein